MGEACWYIIMNIAGAQRAVVIEYAEYILHHVKGTNFQHQKVKCRPMALLESVWDIIIYNRVMIFTIYSGSNLQVLTNYEHLKIQLHRRGCY